MDFAKELDDAFAKERMNTIHEFQGLAARVDMRRTMDCAHYEFTVTLLMPGPGRRELRYSTMLDKQFIYYMNYPGQVTDAVERAFENMRHALHAAVRADGLQQEHAEARKRAIQITAEIVGLESRRDELHARMDQIDAVLHG